MSSAYDLFVLFVSFVVKQSCTFARVLSFHRLVNHSNREDRGYIQLHSEDHQTVLIA